MLTVTLRTDEPTVSDIPDDIHQMSIAYIVGQVIESLVAR
jgi:hypothetical protein